MINLEYIDTLTAAPPAASAFILEERTREQQALIAKARKASLALLSTTLLMAIQPGSPVYKETAKTFVSAFAKDQRLDAERTDLRVIARVRELGTYRNGWDGTDGKAPSNATIHDAEQFVRALPYEEIYAPHVSLAADGEINFLWTLPHFRLDLGFYGDGTYSYYGRTTEGKEFIADEESVGRPLAEEIIDLIRK